MSAPEHDPFHRRSQRAVCAIAWVALSPIAALAAIPACAIKSGPMRTPVIELYTSEGCSSCPPADKWLSTLKGKPVVAQAFHVAYWDYIGWKDKFAQPEFAARQRDIATHNGLTGIYTPQLVRNGQDWRDYGRTAVADQPARATLALQRLGDADAFEAVVEPADSQAPWSAYWSVTEDAHATRVRAGENAGEYLKHDFVVRQFVPVGRFQGAQVLKFYAVAAPPEHPRRVNLVVSDARSGEPLQALSLSCP